MVLREHLQKKSNVYEKTEVSNESIEIEQCRKHYDEHKAHGTTVLLQLFLR